MATSDTNPQLIEKVIYTASLASDPATVEPMMDPVRAITSRISQSADLTANDVATLNAVQSKLENYLLTNEKLRTFTPESLKLQIEQHLKGESGYKRSKIQLGIIIALVVAAAAAVVFAPGAPSTPFLLVRLVGFTVVAALHLGAAWLFLSALGSFKSELRKAFIIMCLGVAVLGLALLEQPLIELFGLRDVPFIGLVISAPLVIAAFIFYLGIHFYTRLVGAWSKMWPIAVAATTVALVSFFSPHLPVDEPELAFDIAATLQGWVAIFPTISFFILGPVVGKLAEIYKPPARALRQSMAVIMAATIYVFVVRLVAGSSLAGIVGVVALTLLIIEGIFLVRAGYVFNKVSRY